MELDGDLAGRFRAARRQKKLSQKEVATAADVALRTVSAFERRQSTPQPDNLRALLNVVGLEGSADSEIAEATRGGWPQDVQVFLDILGAYLVTQDETTRLAMMSGLIQDIVRGRDQTGTKP